MTRKRIDDSTKQKVIEAREKGQTLGEIAREFEISRSSVSRIVQKGSSVEQQKVEREIVTERQKKIQELERRIAELEKKILEMEAKKSRQKPWK